jgi:hypothetical protein
VAYQQMNLRKVIKSTLMRRKVQRQGRRKGKVIWEARKGKMQWIVVYKQHTFYKT